MKFLRISNLQDLNLAVQMGYKADINIYDGFINIIAYKKDKDSFLKKLKYFVLEAFEVEKDDREKHEIFADALDELEKIKRL